MKHREKFERWAERELRRNIGDAILTDDDDGYIVFGRYHLRPDKHKFTVWQNNEVIASFSSKKTAISWCVAEKNKVYNLARDILNLDRKKQQVQQDIECRSRVADKGSSPEFKEMVRTKLEPKNKLYRDVSSELEKCLNRAKYLQLRGFSNETARTGRA